MFHLLYLNIYGANFQNVHQLTSQREANHKNFRRQEYSEVLPRDERPMHLHNNAYRNDGGEGGRREYPPYLYLFSYWAGRYVDAISTPMISK